MSSGVTYEFDVKMTCGGCSGAVTRALGKVEGIESYDVNLEKQTVVVHPTTATYDEVLEKIKKTGKEVRSGKTLGAEPSANEPSANEPSASASEPSASGPPANESSANEPSVNEPPAI